MALLGLGACAQPTEAPPSDAFVAPRDAHFDAFVLPAVVPSVPGYCAAPADCDDDDPCTEDVCHAVSPVRFHGTCTNERMDACVTPPDAGRPDAARDAATSGRDAEPGPLDPVDPACSGGSDVVPVLLPFVPLGPPSLDIGCERGLEWQNCSGSVSLRATRSGGSAARTLVVDVATYTAPDRLRIHGIDALGEPYVLLDTCRLRTWDVGDPTDGHSRPPDEAIRRFEVALREGTRSLTLDATGAPSPWYMRVLGTCDFVIGTIDPGCDSALRDAIP